MHVEKDGAYQVDQSDVLVALKKKRGIPMPVNNREYYDSYAKHRRKRVALVRKLTSIWLFVLIGCPILVACVYRMGFRLEH